MSDTIKRLTKEDGQSKDLVNQNIEKLNQLFPEIVTDGKVDFETLKEELGDFVDDSDERYSFTWNGKSKARKLAMEPSRGTLRPVPEESVNWDSTEHLFIEGDNLEVLKLLQRSYHKKIKIIYIDPPYNTGNDFIYKDDYQDSLGNYLSSTGQLDEEGNKISSNPETSGRYHTDWLNMVYPRIRLAKELISEDGLVIVNIGDEEISNLKHVLNEVFGEENFIANLVWEKKKKGTFLSGHITNLKDHILVYAKNKEKNSGLIGEINTDVETYPCINDSNAKDERLIPSGIKSKFKERDYFLPKGEIISEGSMEIKLLSDLEIEDYNLKKDVVMESNWRYTQDAINKYAKEDNLYVTEDLYIRRIVDHPREKTLKDILLRKSNSKELDLQNLNTSTWGTNEDAKEEQLELFGIKNIMDYPKPSILILKLLKTIRDDNCLVLDFFAGSCTTAHAVLELNRLDGGERKFINVQLPEVFDESKDTHKNAIKLCKQNNLPLNFASIGKERIRRVINEIYKEHPEYEGDLGFKVFKLDSSNIKPWDPTFDEVQLSIEDSIENVKPDRSEKDLLYEILLKYGIDLSLPIEERHIADTKVYVGGAGALVLCPSDNITLDVVEGIAEIKEEFDPEIMRVVFRDSGFKDDMVKTNAIQILKQHGIEDVRSI